MSTINVPWPSVELHVQHNQKAHGRSGVKSERVRGSAAKVRTASAERVAGLQGSEDPRVQDAVNARQSYLTFGVYTTMNRGCRDPDAADAETLTKIGHMDDAIALGGVENAQKINVSRGVQGAYADRLREVSAGDVLVEDGFMSTTTSAKISDAYAARSSAIGRGQGVVINITVPPGNRALAGNPPEHELIYGRGSRLRVDSTSIGGQYGDNVYATLLPPE